MSEIKDGGQAFPRVIQRWNETFNPQPGMSLRDWFAGQAIRARWNSGEPMSAEDAAHFAYQLADAMLAAREAKP